MVENAPLTESEAAAANNELENFALIDEIEEATKDVPDDDSPKPLNPDEERQPEDTSLIDQLLRVSPVLRCSAADALAFTRVAESGIDGQLATAALEAAAAALPLMLPPHDSPEQEVSCSTPGSSSTSSYMSTCDSITDHIDMACPERLEPRSGQASPLGKSACPSCCGWRCR